MERFSIENKVKDISFGQFREVANTLYSGLKEVRPGIKNILRLTTNKEDYKEYCRESLSENVEGGYIEAMRRKEFYCLNELKESLWKRSFLTELIIEDNTLEDKYAIYLANGLNEPKRIFVFSESLDRESRNVLGSLWHKDFLKKIGEIGEDVGRAACMIGSGDPCNYISSRVSKL